MKRLLAVALLLVALTLVRPPRGEARYEYARQVGKRCSACHVGGHPDVTNLNPAGLHFMARGTLAAVAADPKKRASAGDAGGELFAQNCAPCHGTRGQGTDKAKSLSPPARAPSATEIEKVIREGIAGTTMFAFGEVLSAAEIETLARHVEELRRP